MDTDTMTTLLRSGRIRGMTWDACAVKYARLCLPSIVDLESLSLIDNRYAATIASTVASSAAKTIGRSRGGGSGGSGGSTSTLTTLLTLLPPSVRTLRIEQDDAGSTIQPLAAAVRYWREKRVSTNVRHLELIITGEGCCIDDGAAEHLRTVVQSPRLSSLTISFTPGQGEYHSSYRTILRSIRRGLDDVSEQDDGDNKTTVRLPRIVFRRVTLPDHEVLFTDFVRLACETDVVTALQLHPYKGITAVHRNTDCRVGATFFRALIALLSRCQRLTDLEITHIEAHPELRNPQGQRRRRRRQSYNNNNNNDDDDDDEEDDDGHHDAATVWSGLRRALEGNTALRRLSLRSTRGLTELWSHAVFPALAAGNRTVRRLEFAHVHGTAVTASFLSHLPDMTGIRYVHAPARQSFGRVWYETVRNAKEPMDLTVEFTLGAFSAVGKYYHDGAIESILQRNRLYVRAGTMLSEKKTRDRQTQNHRCCDLHKEYDVEEEEEEVERGEEGAEHDEDSMYLHALVNFGRYEHGLSALYVIVRNGCLSWF